MPMPLLPLPLLPVLACDFGAMISHIGASGANTPCSQATRLHLQLYR